MPATESPFPFSPCTDGSSTPYSVATLGPAASCSPPCRSTCLMKTPLSTIALRGSPGSRSSATSRCPWITNSRFPSKPKLPITAGAAAILFHPSHRPASAPRSRGDADDESDDPGPFSVLVEVRRRNEGEQVARQKGGKRGHGRARKTGDEIADEAHRDDHGPRRDHRHRDRVDELALAQPVVLVHHASVQERHDREAAAEHEGSGFAEEQSDLHEERPVDDRGHAGRGRKLGGDREHR